MAANLITEEDINILEDENKVHDEKFQHFHNKAFDEMLTEATFLAFKILERNGQKPGVGDFQNELNYLIKHIMKEKIELLGVYLKNDLLFDFIVW